MKTLNETYEIGKKHLVLSLVLGTSLGTLTLNYIGPKILEYIKEKNYNIATTLGNPKSELENKVVDNYIQIDAGGLEEYLHKYREESLRKLEESIPQILKELDEYIHNEELKRKGK